VNDENKLIAERRAKLAQLRAAGVAFPNDFRRDVLASELQAAFGERDQAWFSEHPTRVRVGGRMMFERAMGKVSFAKLAEGKYRFEVLGSNNDGLWSATPATLDILAPGRVLLGLGAGHTPREWTDIGRERPGPDQRAERLAEFAAAVAALLRGQAVSREGGYVALRESRLEDLPVGDGVKLAVGGGHPLILRAAARHADVVALSGLGRTLPDGHHHEVRWSRADLDRQLRVVREEARLAGTGPVIEALVQVVDVTGNRTAAIDDLSTKIAGATTEDLARTPFLLIGSHEEMAAQMLSQAEELGITRYVIREAAVPALDRVLDLIASPGRLPPSATFG